MPTSRAYAVDEIPEPDEAQMEPEANDTTAPVISTNIIDDQALSGTTQIRLTVEESHPREYSIYVFNPDNSNVVVDGNPVGVVQNPASGTELTFNWDTTQVANGNYRVVFSASDQYQTTTVEVGITVLNESGEPTYPPITPVLEPITMIEPIGPSLPRRPPQQTPSDTHETGGDTQSTKKDVLAARIKDAASATQHTHDTSPQSCALFFGVCWYWSVPTMAIVGATAYGVYRFRLRSV